MYISIGQAAEIIGVSISTLRRWEKEKYFCSSFKTKGGHRRYCLKEIQLKILNISPSETSSERKAYVYARVSSADQELDLKHQEKRLAKYCQSQNWDFEVISDLGSGINYKKKGLNQLIKLICDSKVSRLVLTYRDRLLRFGSPLLFKLCECFGCDII